MTLELVPSLAWGGKGLIGCAMQPITSKTAETRRKLSCRDTLNPMEALKAVSGGNSAFNPLAMVS